MQNSFNPNHRIPFLLLFVNDDIELILLDFSVGIMCIYTSCWVTGLFFFQFRNLNIYNWVFFGDNSRDFIVLFFFFLCCDFFEQEHWLVIIYSKSLNRFSVLI